MSISHPSILCLFFLMNRRPPRSSPFPYTTPFRSRPRLQHRDFQSQLGRAGGADQPGEAAADRVGTESRSEEHTSELQSRSDLVCRLLLEKKNIQPLVAVCCRHTLSRSIIKPTSTR